MKTKFVLNNFEPEMMFNLKITRRDFHDVIGQCVKGQTSNKNSCTDLLIEGNVVLVEIM